MSQFKAMKFWVGRDVEVARDLLNILFKTGVCWGDGTQGFTNLDLNKDCYFVSPSGYLTFTTDPSKAYFYAHENQEVNIDWMRTPKEETIELNGKKYLKEDLTAEVGKQTVSALEEALKNLKPVG